MGVGVQLSLVDQAFLAFMHEFDRVFDRQDVAVLGVVLVVHHRREGGRLTRTRCPRHQHEAALFMHESANGLG